MPVLGEEPARMTSALNEWWRFDGPARYRLFLRSRRIQRDRAGDGVATETATSTATSTAG